MNNNKKQTIQNFLASNREAIEEFLHLILLWKTEKEYINWVNDKNFKKNDVVWFDKMYQIVKN